MGAMDALAFFGLPGALIGIACGVRLRPRHVAVVAAVVVVLAGIFGALGTTAEGETAGGWLGFIVAGLQLAGFAVGVAVGSLIRHPRSHGQATTVS
jgi:hypothetical protein